MSTPVIAGHSSNVQTLRDLEKAAMADGALSTKDIQALQKAAKTDAERAVVDQMLKADAFEPGVQKKVAGRSTVAGAAVGNTQVARVLGAPEGYASRFEAIGAARLLGAQNLAVVQGADHRWRAVETKAPLTTPSKAALALPPIDAQKVAQARARYEAASDEPQRLAAATELAAATLGVPAGDINAVSSEAQVQPGKLNININPNAKGDEGTTFLDKRDAEGNPAISLHLGVIKNHPPAYAATTLFHEGVHASDARIVADLRAQYDLVKSKPMMPGDPVKKNGRWVEGPKKPATFEYWVSLQATKGKVSAAVKDLVDKSASKTAHETHAHAESFMASFRSDPATALGELTQLDNDYSNDKSFTRFVGPELRAFFDGLTPQEQVAFKKQIYDVFSKRSGMTRALLDTAFPEGLR